MVPFVPSKSFAFGPVVPEGSGRTFSDTFRSAIWNTTGRTGAPLLETAVAYVDCETVAEHDAGDHVLVVGKVVELGYAPEGKPLLFYRGGYGRFEA